MSAASAVVGLLVVLVGGLLIRSAGDGPTGVDQAWHTLVAGARSPAADQVALMLNTIGGTASMTVILAVVAAVFLILRRWRASVTIVAGGITATLASEALKALIARPRPIDATVLASGGSYPSGHTTMAAFVAVALAIMLRRSWVWAAAGAWIAVMAWSRTYLLVHWLTDTVAGAVLGASVALLVSWLLTREAVARRRRPLSRTDPSSKARTGA